MPFPVVAVDREASSQLEQLGTKRKFWFSRDRRSWLFKQGRVGTGENWAERSCCETARALGLPHAEYHLALCDGDEGVVTPKFLADDAVLVLGNQLLGGTFAGYETQPRQHRHSHTPTRVYTVLKTLSIGVPLNWPAPDWATNASAVFLGYLMLDALVGNTDRHDENWGIIGHDRVITLAPTFDHASSLGRNESDHVRVERLTTRDVGRNVEAYARKARSALYRERDDAKPMSPIDAFFSFAQHLDKCVVAGWLARLEQTSVEDIAQTFEQFPPGWISEPAKDFAIAFLRINRKVLLAGL